MKDNYPLMTQSEERSAPWNEGEPTPIDVDCCVSYCMSKSMTVSAIFPNNDIDGVSLVCAFNSDVNALGIPTLLKELRHLTELHIERLRGRYDLISPCDKEKGRICSEIKYYESILSASKGWMVDDLDVEKE